MQIKNTNKSRKSTVALAICCFVLQVAIASNIGLEHGRANLALVFCGVYALWKGGRKAVVAGFVAGVIYDLLTTGPFGLMAGLCTLVAYGLGIEARNRFVDGMMSAITSFGIASFIALLFYHLTMVFLGESSNIIDMFVLRTLPSFTMTFIAFLPFAYWRVRESSKSHGLGSGSKGAAAKRGSHYDVRNL